MAFPVGVRNKLLDNVFKGVGWDTPNISFGQFNWRVSSTQIAADGTGYTAVSGSSGPSFTGSNLSAASGGTQVFDIGGGTLLNTAATSKGTLSSIVIFEGNTGQSVVRAYFNFPVARNHVQGDSLAVTNGRISISIT